MEPGAISLKATGRGRRRLLVEPRRRGRAVLAAVLAIAVLAIVVWSVGSRGVGAINLDFFTKGPSSTSSARPAAASRRRSWGRCSSSASRPLIALPIGVLTAIYVSEFAPVRSAQQIRLWLDVLNGFPSIVIGIFVFTLAVKTKVPLLGIGHHQSAIAGGFALAIIMLPLVARSTMEVLRLVPNELREASYALGVSKWQTVLRVVLPTSFGGILTGTTLAVARAAGETAPLLFTCAIAGQIVDWNPTHSVQSIPLHDLPRTRSRPTRPAPAGVGGGVRPDRVRARDEPHGAPAARTLAPQARRVLERARTFTTPSPGVTGVCPRGRDGGRWRRHERHGQETTHDPHRAGAAVLVAAAAATAKSTDTTITGAGSTFVSAARRRLDAGARHGVRLHGAVQRRRLRRRHRGDHQPTRSTSARPTRRSTRRSSGVPGLHPDPVGAVGHRGRLQRPGRARCTSTWTARRSRRSSSAQITNWNDPAIKALNKGANLPDLKITPVFRSDGSGTSYNFTDYLSSVNATWKTKIGASTQPAFPAGQGAQGLVGRRRPRLPHERRDRLRRRRLRDQEPHQVRGRA